MKKVLFLFFSLFIFINNVNAVEWQEEIIEGDNVETQYRYRFYREVEDGKYVRKGIETDHEYEVLDNITYSNYSGYLYECPSGEGYELQYATEYLYQEILPVQYIKILNTSNEELDIAEFSPIVNDYLVDNEIYECENCDFDGYLIYPGGNTIFKLDYSVSVRNLHLVLEMFNSETNANYQIIYSNDKDFNQNSLVSVVYANVNNTKYTKDNIDYLYSNYTSTIAGYDINIDEYIKVITTKNVCKYREIMTYRYSLNKEYYDDNYYKDIGDIPGLSEEEKNIYIKDTDDYKIYYRYIDTNENIEKDTTNKESTLVSNHLKLVNTGIKKPFDYKYLIIFVLSLILIALLLLKRIKIMSSKNNN